MGCVSSRNVDIVGSPILADRQDGSGPISATSLRYKAALRAERDEEAKAEKGGDGDVRGEAGVLARARNSRMMSFRMGNISKHVEGEQAAAGWPVWLTAFAGEAIQGWVPLKADNYEKLEKIGQGTYSSVFRARDLETGKIFALKKVRFDNFEPESVRFMAREIQILRRLDHPNIIKLEGLITSRLSCSLYLVFEYMEHDLAGLSSSPDIKFSESQIKCYTKQILSGLEHCHSRGIIHRDIKGANLLVNNEGIVKMADFGLANFYKPGQKQPLTSRVVTLWYRPPELLLGSTDYEESVDLWSVGCVFAEMFTGKPILQGRTEVEQLHKIFKLCGSPVDEYWKKSKLPHATIFKPHHPYESHLEETFKTLPSSAVSLLETLLSVEPYKRGTASSALSSEYFRTMPYACEPSSLPQYPPNKEIDAKNRDEMRRRRVSIRAGAPEAIRPMRADRGSRLSSVNKVADSREEPRRISVDDVKQVIPHINGEHKQRMPAIKQEIETRCTKRSSQEDIAFSGPLPVSASSGFAWAKRQRDERANGKYQSRSSSKFNFTGGKDATNLLPAKINPDVDGQENGDVHHANGKSREQQDLTRRAILKSWTQLERPDSFDYSNLYHSQEILKKGDAASVRQTVLGYQDQDSKFEYSGPLMSQSHKLDELLQKNERHVRQAIRKSWLQKVTRMKIGK